MNNLKIIIKYCLFVCWWGTLAYAQWSDNSELNTPVCTNPASQFNPFIVSDGQGGAFVTWLDYRQENSSVYVTRLDPAGQVMWGIEGMPAALSEASQTSYRISSDGFGGILLIWREGYNSIFVQRMNAIGGRQWTDNGRSVKIVGEMFHSLNISGDLKTGIIGAIQWYYPDYYLQINRFNGSGTPTWGSTGKTIRTNYLNSPQIVTYNDGTVLVGWLAKSGIYAQKYAADGQVLWDSTGVLVAEQANQPWYFQLIDDGFGGAIINWSLLSLISTDAYHYVQRINASGEVLWESPGVLYSRDWGFDPGAVLINKNGGCYLLWKAGAEVVTQRIDPDGNLGWTSTGNLVSNTNTWLPESPRMVADGANGVIIAWIDSVGYDSMNIYAQRLNPAGNKMWSSAGIPVSTAWGPKESLEMLFDGASGAILVWTDYRNDIADIYAQRIDRLGFLGRDATAPAISHLPVETTTENEPLTISAEVTDRTAGIKTVLLHYQPGGAAGFSLLPMMSLDLKTYTSTIPAKEVTSKGLLYFISAEDHAGNDIQEPTSGSFSISVRMENLVKATPQPAKKYQMIALPMIPDNAFPLRVLDNLGAYDRKQWRLFQWEQAILDYVEFGETGFGDFKAGKGFWLITKESKTLESGPGRTVAVNQHFGIQLIHGWNVIANPFNFEVDWEQVVKSGCSNSLWDFDGTGYVQATGLTPWKGYFLYGYSDTSYIEIPPIEPSPVRKTALNPLPDISPDAGEWFIRITAECEAFKDDANFLGMQVHAAETWDAADCIEPPAPPGPFIACYFPHPDWKTLPQNYAADFRPVVANGFTWQAEVNSNIHNAKARLTFQGVETLPANYHIYLTDELNSFSQDLRKDAEYIYITSKPSPRRQFRIAIGPDEYFEQNHLPPPEMPTRFELTPNFPNPFNTATCLRYSVPAPGKIRLTILNLLGEQIRTIVHDKFHEAGHYQVVWDGRDDYRQSVAAGLYFCQMIVEKENVSQTRKMLFLK